MELKGLSFCNSRYEDNQEVIDEFTNRVLNEIEKTPGKVYKYV